MNLNLLGIKNLPIRSGFNFSPTPLSQKAVINIFLKNVQMKGHWINKFTNNCLKWLKVEYASVRQNRSKRKKDNLSRCAKS